jgi:ABC-2 type transport system permease protein
VFTIIAGKDLREFVRDGRLLWAGGLTLVLMLTALIVGWGHQVEIQAERIAGQALDYDAWLGQGRRHPHDAATQGMHVFKPEPPLAIFDPGIEPFVGSTVWLQAHRQSEVKFRPAQDATGLRRFGNLSAAWVLQTLAPLLIIILGFNAMSGERESGTLRQLLSLGVSTRTLLLGKASALGFGVALLLIPGALLLAVITVASVPAGERLDIVWRLGWLGLGYGLYLSFFIFLVLAVSALARSSRAALILLLGLWIAGSLVAPRAASELASLIDPSPSRLEFDGKLSAEMAAASEEAWFRNFGVRTKWDASVPLSKWGAALAVDDHAGYGVYDQHFGALWDTFERQQRMHEWIGLFAPLVAVRGLSMGMAGTDFAQHRDFAMAAEVKRRTIQDIVSEDLVKNADPIGNAHFTYKAGAELWAAVPRFEYRLPTVSFALERHWQSLVTLFAAFGFSVLLAGFAFSRRLMH